MPLQWLNYLKTKPLKIKEFYSPKQENLNLLAKHTIIMKDNNFGYSHKITLKDKVDQRFYKWLTSNPDKVKIGNTCLDSIKKGHYVRGFYFYIKNEKILSLISECFKISAKPQTKFLLDRLFKSVKSLKTNFG